MSYARQSRQKWLNPVRNESKNSKFKKSSLTLFHMRLDTMTSLFTPKKCLILKNLTLRTICTPNPTHFPSQKAPKPTSKREKREKNVN